MLSRIDDLVLLAQVIDAGSFTAASRITGLQKSRLSRRIADLEAHLGVRLIERTSRSFRVTELGMQLYKHASSIRRENDEALALVENRLADPSGPLCIACPVVLAELIVSQIAIDFAAQYPQVQLTFDVISGMPDVEPDHYDLILRAAPSGLPDSEMIARQLMRTPYDLIASPEWIAAAGHPASVNELDGLDGIGWWQIGTTPRWHLLLDDGTEYNLPIRPRLLTNNLLVARQAAMAGLGMARLPKPMCEQALSDGRLRRVVPNVTSQPMVIYVVYPTRRSLTAAGRRFLEQLELRLTSFVRDHSSMTDG